MILSLLSLLIYLAIIGLIVWAILQIPGLPPIAKTIIYVVVGVVILLWLLEYVQSGRLPTLR